MATGTHHRHLRLVRKMLAQDRERNLCQPRKAKDACGGRRDIDDASADKWAAIVDPYDGRAAVAPIGHLYVGSERQGAVRRSHSVGPGALAARGASARI